MKTRLLGSGLALAIVGIAGAQANEECSSAEAIQPNTPTFFSTVSATGSTDPVDDTQCAGTFLDWGDPGTNPDVWFAFTPDQEGLATFTTCDPAGFDTSMVLYTGSCGDLTQIACNGDGTGETGCQAFYSRIADLPVEPGVTYYIRLGGYNAETGTGNLTVQFLGFGGCAGAEGSCIEAHPTPGCDNQACCAVACDIESFCCDVEWDEFCVQIALKNCDYVICPDVPGAPANNCPQTATVVPGGGVYPFNSNGATTVGPAQSAATCSSGNDFFFNDLYWQFQAGATGTAVFSTCGTTPYDNKLALYDLGLDPASFDYNNLALALVACNDDGPSGECFLTDGVTNYASELSATVQQGRTYLVRMGSYNEGETGTGTIAFTLPNPCELPDATSSEAEACGENTDGGCTDPDGGSPSQPIALGDVLAGTFYFDGDIRDTDWYRLTLAEDTLVTVDVHATVLVDVFMIGGTCDDIILWAEGVGNCPTASSRCLSAGEYWVFVAPSFDGPVVDCGTSSSEYVMAVEGVPATCPLTISTACDNPGPDSATINADAETVENGLVACAVAGPTGGTTVNSYARVFEAGSVDGGITCLNFGAYSAVSTAEGLFFSDIPLPATIGIYRDLNGGAPLCKTTDGGADGCDLELVWDSEILIPGGVYKGTINFDEPLCVEPFAGENLVVIIDFPSLFAGVPEANVPGGSGYQLRPGGNGAGPGFNTYCRLSCADTGFYQLTEDLGPTFTAQWVVEINGDFSTCDGAQCIGDLNVDGVVNGADLAILLGAWGACTGCPADLNTDGLVNGADLAILLGAWGNCG